VTADLLPLRFESFTSEHLGLVAVFVAVFVLLVAHGRRHRDDERFRRRFAVVILCFTVPFQVLQLLPSDFDLGTSLPLQYCDITWMAAVVALWTRAWWAVALTVFWGLTLTIQGVVTPSLGQEFPDPRYFMYWGMHFLSIWAAGWLVGSGSRLGWRDYRIAVLVTGAWAAFVMAFNAVTGTNYGYLNRKPAGASILDLLPGWPAYVVVEVVIVAAAWALLTRLLGERREREVSRPGSPAPGSG
jgi:hypothetical integral membrane protein (TIGR02206 family)